jgi:esterase/lipase superfamily enzyme
MQVEEHLWPSPHLGHDMALKVYGHTGRPVVAFPSLNGRYFDFEGGGMVDAVSGLIEAGRMRLVAVDGIDWQSWTNESVPPADRARRHEDYDRYVSAEVIPFVRRLTGVEQAWATGACMGAFHAANFTFRHPDQFDGLIAMSGLYGARRFVGGHVDDAVYFNSPLLYLPNLNDPWHLDRLRRAKLAIVVGQGAWEDEMIADTRCASLKRFQDDVREVQTNYECGIALEGFNAIQEGDILEFYHRERTN